MEHSNGLGNSSSLSRFRFEDIPESDAIVLKDQLVFEVESCDVGHINSRHRARANFLLGTAQHIPAVSRVVTVVSWKTKRKAKREKLPDQRWLLACAELLLLQLL
jgi:hypothetical protein